jgi:rhodanese-related sulfurtransferase
MFFSSQKCDNINPDQLNAMIGSRHDFLLLDVRTRQENAEQAIRNSLLIPVQELSHRLQELPKDKEIVIYCRVGNRSAFACAFLASRGYKVKNLEGGILLWNMSRNTSMRETP